MSLTLTGPDTNTLGSGKNAGETHRFEVVGPHGAVTMQITEYVRSDFGDRASGSYHYHRPEAKHGYGMEVCPIFGECEPSVGSQKHADGIVDDWTIDRDPAVVFAALKIIYRREWGGA